MIPKDAERMKNSEIFNCKRCGYCCHGETTVSLNEDDRSRMASCLGLSEEETEARYWRVTDGCVQMKTVDGHCIFYKDGCRVHQGRPWRCAQWPLHPSILIDAVNLETIKESCPGIDRNVSYQEFCRIIEHTEKTDDVNDENTDT
jgi:uncharacterized protein